MGKEGEGSGCVCGKMREECVERRGLGEERRFGVGGGGERVGLWWRDGSEGGGERMVWCVVVGVEWLISLKEQLLLEELTSAFSVGTGKRR